VPPSDGVSLKFELDTAVVSNERKQEIRRMLGRQRKALETVVGQVRIDHLSAGRPIARAQVVLDISAQSGGQGGIGDDSGNKRSSARTPPSSRTQAHKQTISQGT
jgi:hypothetical protein